eukprot:751279-Pleurochrysis_carterae.AAC.1
MEVCAPKLGRDSLPLIVRSARGSVCMDTEDGVLHAKYAKYSTCAWHQSPEWQPRITCGTLMPRAAVPEDMREGSGFALVARSIGRREDGQAARLVALVTRDTAICTARRIGATGLFP